MSNVSVTAVVDQNMINAILDTYPPQEILAENKKTAAGDNSIEVEVKVSISNYRLQVWSDRAGVPFDVAPSGTLKYQLKGPYTGKKDIDIRLTPPPELELDLAHTTNTVSGILQLKRDFRITFDLPDLGLGPAVQKAFKVFWDGGKGLVNTLSATLSTKVNKALADLSSQYGTFPLSPYENLFEMIGVNTAMNITKFGFDDGRLVIAADVPLV